MAPNIDSRYALLAAPGSRDMLPMSTHATAAPSTTVPDVIAVFSMTLSSVIRPVERPTSVCVGWLSNPTGVPLNPSLRLNTGLLLRILPPSRSRRRIPDAFTLSNDPHQRFAPAQSPSRRPEIRVSRRLGRPRDRPETW